MGLVINFEVPGAENVPMLEMIDGKISHTLHLVFHSQDKVRRGILVTHSKCDSDHIDSVETEWEYAEGISVFRHTRTNLLVASCDSHIKTWVGEDVADVIYDFVTSIPKRYLIFLDKTTYAPDGFVCDENVEVSDTLPDLGGPLMAKIIDGASGQNNIQVKLKHQRARCLLYYIQGDPSKLAQPNDQTPNKAVVDFLRRGSVRYFFP